MKTEDYLAELQKQYSTGSATEHTYRPALKTLLESAISVPQLTVINEPRQIDCGAPDFVLTSNNIPFGYAEAKDAGANLDDKAHKEQLTRYTESLDNLIFTNYLEFRLFRDGKQVRAVSIGRIANGRIEPIPHNLDEFAHLLSIFSNYEGQTITSAADLAARMAAKAKLLAKIITTVLTTDEEGPGAVSEADNELQNQLDSFKKYLIKDLEPDTFADIYAQTVAYGMFSARLNPAASGEFTRVKAAELLPASNPFLRKFFQHIAGYNLDERIRWILDDLADIFKAADVGELMKKHGKDAQRNDPVIHFYETFLGEYNPKQRKERGVYYTPQPVVSFIVRAVDTILRTEFALPDGLADTSKITIDDTSPADSPQAGNRKKQAKQQVHRVQILDPATGTGTFLTAIAQHIYEHKFSSQKGIWPDYVREELIPRLNGFEVLMAPYAMAHIQLERALRKTDFTLGSNRLQVFLTNALEAHHPDTQTLFAQWLATEVNEANVIKDSKHVMVVLGNPPYKGESANKNIKWIEDALRDYKQEPGGGKLQEKNSKWLNDDYVKFIRYGQHYIDRTGEGVLAYINNHSFLDSPTFRGMRWRLLQSFDKIYILDLHGNSRQKETASDGSADDNVFDIRQGVSINLFVKTGQQKKAGEMAKVLHCDLYGTRQSKYQFLWDSNLDGIDFKELKPRASHYFFMPQDTDLLPEYEKGFSVKELFKASGTGIMTKKDKLAIHFSPEKALQAAEDILAMDKESFYRKYNLPKDVRDWKYEWAKNDIAKFGVSNQLIQPVTYRPFDLRNIVFTGESRGFIARPVIKIMRHFIEGANVGLITSRITKDNFSVLCTNNIAVHKSATTYDGSYIFPLYSYPEQPGADLDGKRIRQPNLKETIVKTIADSLDLRFTPEREGDSSTFAPIDLLDYIYAVLHAPAYRQRYSAYLKTDYPRVPYPADKAKFRSLAKLGAELRTLHLLTNPTLQTLITDYPKQGSHIVDSNKPKYEITDPEKGFGEVRINKTQYFKNVPKIAWDFYISGYQPARKWLKDRRGRQLSHNDIVHYQKIIVALTETARLMAETDKTLHLEETAPPK